MSALNTETHMELADKQIFCVITGASRGFGRCVAESFLSSVATRKPSGVELVLHARPTSKEQLSSVANQLKASYVSVNLNVRIAVAKLEDGEDALKQLSSSFHAEYGEPNVALLFNNAGIFLAGMVSTLPLSKLADSFAVNASAMAWLAGRFLEAVPEYCAKYVVHITSHAGVLPGKTMGAYCASKAASTMLHKVLALERPDVRVLQFGPGPLKTDMTNTVEMQNIIEEFNTNPLRKGPQTNIFLEPSFSARKMMDTLLEDKFLSGSHIDIYD